MSEIEVLELVLRQMGDLRIPMRETELREQLVVIGQNIQALRDAMIQARDGAGTDGAGPEEEGGGE